jgi:hypothetical protein
MTAQQKKDADKANIGVKAAAKAAKAAEEEAAGPKMDKDKVRADAAYQRHLAEGGAPKGEVGTDGKKKKKKKEDLSFLDDAIKVRRRSRTHTPHPPTSHLSSLHKPLSKLTPHNHHHHNE